MNSLMNRIYDKRPREHRKRFHYNGKGVAKIIFKSEYDATTYIKKKHLSNYKAYICLECNHWHIGRKYI